MLTRPLSRRQVLRVTYAGGLACFFPAAQGVPLTLDQQRRDLVERVAWMGQNVSSQNELVQDWLRHSEIVRAARTGNFHNSFANYWQFRSDRPLVAATRFGYGRFGIDRDPWIAAAAYSEEAELNNEEMGSLMPIVASLRGVSFYSRNAFALCPLAKGPRFAPDAQGTHELKQFARIVVNHGYDFGNFDLQYYRYFMIPKRIPDSSGAYESIVAYGYLEKGVPGRQIVYARPA